MPVNYLLMRAIIWSVENRVSGCGGLGVEVGVCRSLTN
jgi:hypothetical protein